MDITNLSALYVIGIIFLAIWSSVWKAFALWRAARQEDKVWFVVLMVLNTAGILELFYLYGFSKRTKKVR